MLATTLALCPSTRIADPGPSDFFGSESLFGKTSNPDPDQYLEKKSHPDQYLEKGRIRIQICIWKKVECGARSKFGEKKSRIRIQISIRKKVGSGSRWTLNIRIQNFYRIILILHLSFNIFYQRYNYVIIPKLYRL